jgi:hypothetical protein
MQVAGDSNLNWYYKQFGRCVIAAWALSFILLLAASSVCSGASLVLGPADLFSTSEPGYLTMDGTVTFKQATRLYDYTYHLANHTESVSMGSFGMAFIGYMEPPYVGWDSGIPRNADAPIQVVGPGFAIKGGNPLDWPMRLRGTGDLPYREANGTYKWEVAWSMGNVENELLPGEVMTFGFSSTLAPFLASNRDGLSIRGVATNGAGYNTGDIYWTSLTVGYQSPAVPDAPTWMLGIAGVSSIGISRLRLRKRNTGK